MKNLNELARYLTIETREVELRLGLYKSPRNIKEAEEIYKILCECEDENLKQRLLIDWNRLCLFMFNKSKTIKDLKNSFENTPSFLPISKEIRKKWKEESEKVLNMKQNLKSLKYLSENIYFIPGDHILKSKASAMHISETERLLQNAKSLKSLKELIKYGDRGFMKEAFYKISLQVSF